MKSPRRQDRQRPQCPPCQPTPTLCPGFQSGTSVPTASTIPTTSCPGTRGYWIPGKAPCLVNESLWQTPQAWTLMRTCRAVGSGTSRSTISKGPLALLTCTARMRDIANYKELRRLSVDTERQIAHSRVRLSGLLSANSAQRLPTKIKQGADLIKSEPQLPPAADEDEYARFFW